jgi:PilZ domain
MYLEKLGTFSRYRATKARRGEPRYVCSVPVTLQRFLRFGPILTRGVSLDMSMRGMSALVCGAPQVGETVVIGLSLGESKIEILATVRHSSDAKTGFEFYPMSPIALEGIERWICELRKSEETLFPYPYTRMARSAD